MNPVCVIEEVSSATQLGSFRTLTCGGAEVLGASCGLTEQKPVVGLRLGPLHAADAGEAFLS